jgi:hypothetical protein
MNGASYASYRAAGAFGDDYDPDDDRPTDEDPWVAHERRAAEYAAYLASMKTYQVKPGGEVLERDRTRPGYMGSPGRHFVAAWWLVAFDPSTLHATLVDAATRSERRVVILKASQRKAAQQAMDGRRLRWAVANGRACYRERSSRNYVPTFTGPGPDDE